MFKNIKIFYLRFPQKSIFGFKILSSFQSSISTYLIILIILFANQFFGLNQLQMLAGAFFNIIANLSIIVLIINLLIKRKELNKKFFILLNSPLFIYLPFSIIAIINNVKISLTILFYN